MSQNGGGNPFEGDTGNPFQDPGIIQHRPNTDYATLDVYNPFDNTGNPPPYQPSVSAPTIPSVPTVPVSEAPKKNNNAEPRNYGSYGTQESTAAAKAELLKRQEELNRKAEELDRRERELQNAALGSGAVSTVALFINFLASLTWFCVESSGGSGFGLSILWTLIFTPCSFVCWYRPMYKAFRSDSSFNFFVFFFIFFAQDVFYVLQAIGIPGWGFSGWIVSFSALGKHPGVGIFMILVAIHSLYRRTGASFQKAQAEFAAGVLSNPTVRTAAANAAAGAASSSFQAP
ncbi:hypothetical protein Chor_005098 [Crotalus horridus]